MAVANMARKMAQTRRIIIVAAAATLTFALASAAEPPVKGLTELSLEQLGDIIHILFITRAETRAGLRTTGKLLRPILIVTESEGAFPQGSVINFLVAGGRVKFEIALEAAEKRGLKLSSRLLTVAQSERTGTP